MEMNMPYRKERALWKNIGGKKSSFIKFIHVVLRVETGMELVI